MTRSVWSDDRPCRSASTAAPPILPSALRLLATKRETSADVENAVRAIIADVAARGDQALIELTRTFDRLDHEQAGLRVTADECAAPMPAATAARSNALAFARDRIEAYHRRQLPKNDRFTDALGVELGSRWTAIESVGLYVPGGTAAYPSSVLMNAVPAKVAGVPRLVMVVPAPDGQLSPLVLAAARLAGIDENLPVGGAQAIAALAYGTETIAPVAKIVGPGNAYVAAAKRLVFGTVGIDMIAGPSEVLDPRRPQPAIPIGSRPISWRRPSMTPAPSRSDHGRSRSRARRRDRRELRLVSLPRVRVAEASWRDFGVIIVVGGLAEAVPLVDTIAPEHLEIASANAEDLALRIRNAGAIFLGPHTPEAIGDYVGGSNHVLPTARSARFSSGLGVPDFMKRTSILKCGPDQLRALAPAAIALDRVPRGSTRMPARLRCASIDRI